MPISGNPLNYPASSTLADDSATSSSQFNVPVEALFDRTAWLNAALSPIATIAALKAIDTTPIADGTVRLVDGFGFYILRTASVLAELQPWVIDPTTGPGRWLHVMKASKPTFKSQTFTSNGTFVLPDTAASADVIVIGYGGGGGGGAGSAGGNSSTVVTAGGGGGGGAVQGVARITLTPGTSYDITIGAGGAGGAGAVPPPTSALVGGDGGDTILALSGTPLATFRGGGGGWTGGSTVSGVTYGPGGTSVRGSSTPPSDGSLAIFARSPIWWWQLPPGAGGSGAVATDTSPRHSGAGSGQGFAGGNAGNVGTGAGSFNAGGPGGGGGAGPGGPGANGGTGGNGSTGATATLGLPGTSAGANTGAGGGGGGAGGTQNGGTGPKGGDGGPGGSGRLTIIWIGA